MNNVVIKSTQVKPTNVQLPCRYLSKRNGAESDGRISSITLYLGG